MSLFFPYITLYSHQPSALDIPYSSLCWKSSRRTSFCACIPPGIFFAVIYCSVDVSLESSQTMLETRPPDLVQLTTMILEEALSRPVGRSRGPSPVKLITSAMSVLSVLLAIPSHSDRVRLCIRSTIALFGSDKSPEFASIALAAKRVTAIYDDPRVVAFRRPTIPQELLYPFSPKTPKCSS